jgi:hypothetical protein
LTSSAKSATGPVPTIVGPVPIAAGAVTIAASISQIVELSVVLIRTIGDWATGAACRLAEGSLRALYPSGLVARPC